MLKAEVLRAKEPQAEELELRLFVFHHSGGSQLSYRDWPAGFPAAWDVRIPDAPGRGPRDKRPPLSDAGALLDHYLEELDAGLTGSFAFFGHSMGGLIAYELTRRLLDMGRTPPVWLGVSAHGTVRPEGDGMRRHLLSDADLREELSAMGGTPSSVLAHPELWDLIAPTVRADLRISETWRTTPLAAPLPVPLSVFGGTRDEVAPPHRMDGWSAVSEHFLGQHLFEGGHFYFQDQLPAVAGRIKDDIRQALLLARAPSAVTL
ncbi:thioesterase [Streptomyces longisporoflavus]|uniref:thioesterase II family protein n=1 Tax=Streptomyces longisporoflavus TaxID=28044 RepID=UPI00167CEF47|nr:alpha/beta fold hydrolase [Streptomyces longisporoflavus]GGV66869.1 thioesterase [Streptomyces longisporoflavus]